MKIRHEQPCDFEEIKLLTEDAFKSMHFASGTEQFIAEKLRADNSLNISLVAVIKDKVVGHIAASKVLIAGQDRGWFGIGPLAVAPTNQGEGIGESLLLETLDRLKQLDAKGCVLVGNPNYYSRVGFKQETELTYPGAPADAFQSLRFSQDAVSGEVAFHPAFKD